MNERREPTISSYSPSKEEARQQSAKRGSARSAPPQSSSHSPAARPLVVKSPLAPFALVLAILACAASGFLYWQLQQSQNQLIEADRRIVDLESKFELSDDESTASLQTMQAKLKWADSEIRKLWGVSYDTNRKAIAVNKSSLEKVEKTANSLSKSLDSRVKAATQGINADLKLVSDLVDAQQTSLSSIEQRNAQIVSSSQSLNDKLNSLDVSRRELERRIKSNEQAIEAIDAFRRNINQQILELKARG